MFGEASRSLVSAKLQGVALRTPPPAESFIAECYVHFASISSNKLAPKELLELATPFADAECSGTQQFLLRKIVRIPSHATVMTLLAMLGLIKEDCTPEAVTVNSNGIRTQMFSVRPATGNGQPFTSLNEADLTATSPLRECIGVQFPFCIAVTPLLPTTQTSNWPQVQWASTLNQVHTFRVENFLLAHCDESTKSRVHNIFRNSTPQPAIDAPEASTLTSAIPTRGGDMEEQSHRFQQVDGLDAPATQTRMRSNSDSQSELRCDDLAKDALKSPATQRKERRQAADAERQRVAELQKSRERNLQQREIERQRKEAEAVQHAIDRECDRSEQVRSFRQLTAIREAKMATRDKGIVEMKQQLFEARTRNYLEQKAQLESTLSKQYSVIFPSSEFRLSTQTSVADPFDFPNHMSSFHRSKSPTKPSARTKSVVDLPQPEETELFKMEKEAAKSNFVNRVAASRKATERRLSKFSMVKLHPFAVNAELRSILENLDSCAHTAAVQMEQEQEAERRSEAECATADYHKKVMSENITRRATMKQEKKQAQLEKHAQQIAFERLTKEDAASVEQKKRDDAKKLIDEHYERKALMERKAREIAKHEEELSQYIDRQREALFSM